MSVHGKQTRESIACAFAPPSMLHAVVEVLLDNDPLLWRSHLDGPSPEPVIGTGHCERVGQEAIHAHHPDSKPTWLGSSHHSHHTLIVLRSADSSSAGSIHLKHRL